LFEQPQAATSPQDERIAELERMVGRLALQLDMAKKVFERSGYPPKGSE
jgi:hypothetical protein